MKIITTRASLTESLKKDREAGKRIGFVATMGALHEGHLSLIDMARKRAEVVVASIFVNPTQFNDSKDLEKYPRPITEDIDKLKKRGCDVVFTPEVEEMYTGNEQWHIDLKGLDTVLEGKQRPGHYQGVTQIVKKLFDIINPDFAFFGQKDYQQFLVISEMVKMLNIPTELVMCPIIRENDGLAMSSRNVHLSDTEHQNALILPQVLKHAQEEFETTDISQIRAGALRRLNHSPGIDLQYFEICDGNSLKPVESKEAHSIIALVAAKVGSTRLIDNIILK